VLLGWYAKCFHYGGNKHRILVQQEASRKGDRKHKVSTTTKASYGGTKE
jgi:hypothetical protein